MIFAKVRFVFDNIKTMILFNFILMKAKFELRFLIRKKKKMLIGTYRLQLLGNHNS